MIHIVSNTITQAWLHTIAHIKSRPQNLGKKYAFDEPALIEINKPTLQKPPKSFPMSVKEIDQINEYIVSGENESSVIHEWTKIYFHRMFDEPNSQVKFFIEELSKNDTSGRSQISIWDKNIDQKAEIAPCVQIIWGRIKSNKLELHVHSNSSDAYNKLFMNMSEFISFQLYIAKTLNVGVGKYIHFIDSCHIKN